MIQIYIRETIDIIGRNNKADLDALIKTGVVHSFLKENIEISYLRIVEK